MHALKPSDIKKDEQQTGVELLKHTDRHAEALCLIKPDDSLTSHPLSPRLVADISPERANILLFMGSRRLIWTSSVKSFMIYFEFIAAISKVCR